MVFAVVSTVIVPDMFTVRLSNVKLLLMGIVCVDAEAIGVRAVSARSIAARNGIFIILRIVPVYPNSI